MSTAMTVSGVGTFTAIPKWGRSSGVTARCANDIATNVRAVGAPTNSIGRVGSIQQCVDGCAVDDTCLGFSFGLLGSLAGECKHHFGEMDIVRTNAEGWATGVCRGSSKLKETDSILPGLDYFQKGIEAIQDVINRTNHVRLPVYAWTTEKNNTWLDPQTASVFAIPDQLSFTENMAGYEQIDDLYTHTFSETITSQTDSTSFSASININYAGIGAGVSYSENKQWYSYKDEVKEKSNYVSHSLMWWKFWEIMAYPMQTLGPTALDPTFASYLKSLPPTISNSSDQQKYDFLVANWGTHYVTWANYGGKLELDIFTDSTFVSEMTQQWMTTQHELDFHFNLYDIDPSASTAGFHNKSEIHRNSSFLNHSRTYLYYEGGNPLFMDEGALTDWRTSIAYAPHWLNVTLAPLWTLPELNSLQSTTLHQFTTKYLSRNTTDPKDSF